MEENLKRAISHHPFVRDTRKNFLDYYITTDYDWTYWELVVWYLPLIYFIALPIGIAAFPLFVFLSPIFGGFSLFTSTFGPGSTVGDVSLSTFYWFQYLAFLQPFTSTKQIESITYFYLSVWDFMFIVFGVLTFDNFFPFLVIMSIMDIYSFAIWFYNLYLGNTSFN